MPSLSRPRLILVFALAAVCACATSRPSGTTDDAGPAVDGAVDAATGLGFGEACVDDVECASRVCHDDGSGARVCTRTCDFDCPDGYACHTVSHDGGDLRVCVLGPPNLCDGCATDEDCGDDGDLCVQLTAGKFCAVDCTSDPTVCAVGFTCQQATSVDERPRRQCLPLNGVCCVDGDGDLHGVGGGCLDADCDDADPSSYVGGRETCDGRDNDCVGGVDDHPLDCAAPMCELGALGYFERPGDVCGGASGCAQQPAVLCDLYTCDGGGEAGDRCATSCDGEVDAKCIPAAHCDASVCLPDVANGQACDEASDCQSGHCANGFCCADGDCCQQASDCPTFGTFDPVCDTPASCQGTRGAAVCNAAFECTTQGGVPDDSACTAATVANDCGWYLPVVCTGAASQAPPACPTSCTSSAQCDPGGFCDPASHTCREDLDDGQACGVDDGRCKSGHCGNGFCCSGGDCCATATDCPASYRSPPVCSSPAACDGEADVATCVASVCGTIVGVDDDSACTGTTVASTCGPYQSVYCTGSATQSAPGCPTSCTSDAECDATAYCNAGGQCVPDQPDGGACADDGECQGGHCGNGFCCASGDCCASSTDCDAYDQAPVCDSPATCQGTRIDGVCSASKQCGAAPVDDDRGCATIEADACGPYPAVVCTAAPAQPPPTCATSCTGDAGCDPSAHCTGGMCVPDAGPGGFCTATNECGSGLQCVDNVCCTSACTGACEACDLPGSVGTCAAVPGGQDPDNECGAQSCVGFYSGWQGDSCRRKADVPANVASCNGARACRTQAQECAASTVAGPVTTTCDATCQDPNLTTCAGTVGGACTNVNPGTQTCGVGACQRTVNQCQNGAPLACTPGAPTAETCNDIDDNCDGTVDNGAFSDAYEPNPDCGTVRTLGAVGSDQANTYTSMTIFGSGDADYYAIPMNETDGSCGCGSFSFDEDYQASVTLTVPPGAGSYEFCMNTDSCGWPAGYCFEVAAGSTTTLSQYLDGACGPGQTDRYTVYVRVRGANAPGFECAPYTLSYFFDAGLCR
ncbi:MAG: hypothetical protein R3B06_31260 [Kofleriaceae bacterium]